MTSENTYIVQKNDDVLYILRGYNRMLESLSMTMLIDHQSDFAISKVDIDLLKRLLLGSQTVLEPR